MSDKELRRAKTRKDRRKKKNPSSSRARPSTGARGDTKEMKGARVYRSKNSKNTAGERKIE